MTNSFWIWLIVAGILLLIELFSMTSYALWVIPGAILTGFTFLLLPTPGFLGEVIVFAVFSSISLFIGTKYFNSKKIYLTNSNILNQRGNQYIGQVYTLDADIINGRGHVRIADTVWQIESQDDLSRGSKVKVIGVNGNRLIVVAQN
ncbi:MAG: NfeD family protein [Gammaproteobacteria bacterium]|nr:NfeD family protein [Gammaproteobacteria bacterium]